MTRKPKFLVLVVLLVLSLTFVGCKQSAAPPLPDEDALMNEDATKNTETMQNATEEPTAEPEGGTEATAVPEPEDTSSSEDTAQPTPTPTSMPDPTPIPDPTEAPTPEVEATPIPELISLPGKHVVQPGENLFRIALKYGMTVEALAQANGITNPALIYVGQELNITGGSGNPTPDPSPAPGGGTTHTVLAGENLFRIALKYNYDQYYLARYNNISNPALIYVGQVIRIP